MLTASIAATLIANLPASNNVRWTPKRKAAVADAIAAGAISAADAAALYNISAAELAGWNASLALAGTPALRVTRLQQYARAA